jgi:hypothetical protein
MSAMRASSPVVLLGAAFLFFPLGARAQSPLNVGLTPATVAVPPGLMLKQKHTVLFFNTNVGSFKIMGSDKDEAEGQLDMSFSGTVLISDMDPKSVLLITGNVRQEIDDTTYHKKVYFGTGHLTIVGRFRAIQWFGRDLRARMNGFGIIRIVGEFDKQLNTGLYWYEGDSQKMYWNTNLMTVLLPKFELPKPNVKVQGGKG